jgi:hypothetical protein
LFLECLIKPLFLERNRNEVKDFSKALWFIPKGFFDIPPSSPIQAALKINYI